MPRPGGPAYGSRVLKLDPAADQLDVWELQLKLLGWGSGSDPEGIGSVMDPMRVTGTFDATTRDAVMRFQRAHALPVTGVVDDAVFRAIDREAALHPVFLTDFKCPCAAHKNDGPIPCHCNDHPNSGVCAGFGNGRFQGDNLYAGTALAQTPADLFDKTENPGVDKALVWALRGVMHRANVKALRVLVGYRCWHDNYHQTDATRYVHKRSIFHLGTSVVFAHDGVCTEIGEDPNAAVCATCATIRDAAVQKCGFQLRFHQPDRPSVAEGGKEDPPPNTPFAVMVSTVRRGNREVADFVQDDPTANAPVYDGAAPGSSLPVDFGDGLDPRTALTAPVFDSIEGAAGGFFPVGADRLWHAGIHLYKPQGTQVHAIAPGKVVGFRAGEAEGAHPYGSRNFVLIEHTWKNKTWFSLTMHLDGAAPAADSDVPWRKALYMRSKPHVLALMPTPILVVKQVGLQNRLLPDGEGLAAGERHEITGGQLDADTVDPTLPAAWKIAKLARNPDAYVFVKRDDVDTTRIEAADVGVANALQNGTILGLAAPIPVAAGELVGRVAAAATDPAVSALGTFVHLETFADQALLTGAGYVPLDASDVSQVANRRAVIEALVAADLLVAPPDGVPQPDERVGDGRDVRALARRSAVLRMPNAWSLDWKAALAASPTFGFIQDGPRDALGDAMNEYRL